MVGMGRRGGKRTPRPGVSMPAVTIRFDRTKEDIRKGSITGSPVSARCQYFPPTLSKSTEKATHQDVSSHPPPSLHATAPATSAQSCPTYNSQSTPSSPPIPSSLSTTSYNRHTISQYSLPGRPWSPDSKAPSLARGLLSMKNHVQSAPPLSFLT